MSRLLAVDGRRTRFNQNLVPDWDKSAAGWNFASSASNGFLRESVADAYSGNFVARATADGSIKDLVPSTFLPCVPGEIFYGEAWIRRVDIASSGEWQLGCTVSRDSGLGWAYPVFTSGAMTSVSLFWTRVFGRLTAPANATGLQIRPSLRNNSTSGILEFDSVILRKVA